jgi:hypothetical protein
VRLDDSSAHSSLPKIWAAERSGPEEFKIKPGAVDGGRGALARWPLFIALKINREQGSARFVPLIIPNTYTKRLQNRLTGARSCQFGLASAPIAPASIAVARFYRGAFSRQCIGRHRDKSERCPLLQHSHAPKKVINIIQTHARRRPSLIPLDVSRSPHIRGRRARAS